LKRLSLFLIPSLWQGFAALITLPLYTYILGPAEFGAFALIASMTGIATAVITSGWLFLLSSDYLKISQQERGRLASTIVILGLCQGLLLSALYLLTLPYMQRLWPEIAAAPRLALYLAIAEMLLGLPWAAALTILVLENRAASYALIMTAKSLLGITATLFALYILRSGMLALFVGAALSAAASCAGAIWVLRGYIGSLPSWRWAREALRLTLTASPVNLLESLHVISERFLLTSTLGLSQLGIYSHSQQYRQLANMPVGALQKSMQSTLLAEAREPRLDFNKTRQAWEPAYLALTIAGICLATCGQDVIRLITHDKFTAAAPWAALWMAYLLIQNSAQAQMGLLYANKNDRLRLKIMATSMSLGIAALFLAIPRWGIAGAVICAFLQQILIRSWLHLSTGKHYDLPRTNAWIISGTALIVLALIATALTQPWGLAGRVMTMSSLLTLCVWPGLRHIKDLIKTLK
ncbi:MAG: oligosaccharide flippase family protein, partial [Elusimicrobiota bacterium]